MKSAVCGLVIFATCAQSAVAQHDYKVSRNLIRAGKLDQAVEVLDNRIQKFSDDSEWVYQLAIARAQLGELESARNALQQARKMGVPDGRVVADSRDLLKPLRGQDWFDEIINQQTHHPIQGPMLGSVTETSARIWVRTAAAADVQVTYFPRQSKEQHRSQTVKTSPETDFTAVLELTDLKPTQQYTYALRINGREVEFPYATEFRTWPREGDSVHFKLAFGGGAGYVTHHERMWDTIGTFRPDALLLLGDNMYSDDPESLTMQRFCYYRRQSPLPFRKLVARTAVASIWDDHDFGTNDCSGGPEIDTPQWKRPVWNVFRQNWVNPSYGGGEEHPGCWYDFHVGDVHFIMLDGRYYRHRPAGTMLGPVQKQWLKKTIAASKATFKVIASPVPWDYRTKGDSKDTWNGFHKERTEIFDFLAENDITGVVLMSADRHRSDAWAIQRPNGYTLYEFNSSRLTNNHVHGTMKEAIFSYNKKQSFGLVEFDTTASDPRVSYTAISIDGEKVGHIDIPHSQLK